MSILVVVSGASLLIFRGITRAWRTGELRTERYQQARLLFDLFGRELSSSVASARFPFLGISAGSGTPGHAGSVFDELLFVGTLPGRAGLVERGYWVTADGSLMCHDGEPADGDYATGTSELCGQDVTGFDAFFFDGTDWLEDWDARPTGPQAGQLPKAIHLVLTIGEKHPERFETVVHIPTS